MSERLRWRLENARLSLAGELERETLQALWQQRAEVMKQVEIIDLADLRRVDSAGLALLVHLRQTGLKYHRAPRFTGITDKLSSLIMLYNLQKIITDSV